VHGRSLVIVANSEMNRKWDLKSIARSILPTVLWKQLVRVRSCVRRRCRVF